MTNNESDSELVQLGSWEIDRRLLDGPGADWEEMLADRTPVESNLPRRARDDFPLKNWRVIDASTPSWASQALIVGAPSGVSPGRWILVQLSQDASGWHLASPIDCLPVQTQALRRQGLRLEWPQTQYLLAKGAEPTINVLLVNTSAQPWIPTEEDLSHVQGIILDENGQQLGSGWYAHGRSAQLPGLSPGEKVALPVLQNNAELDTAPSGRYHLMAWLTSLGLRTESAAEITLY